jgi:hypothetical protein
VSTPEPIPSSRSQTRTIALVTVALALIAGLLIGAVGDRVYLFWNRERGGMRGPHMTQHIVARLDRELQLSPQQRDEVTRILNTRRDHIAAITAAVRPHVRREIDEANAEIEKVLTPEQRGKFEKMRMRMLPGRDHDHGFARGSTPP